MSNPEIVGAKKSDTFKVNREHWADHSIYYGASVHVTKVFDKEKLSGRIIGLSEYKYLILEIPLVIGHRARYAPGSTVIVKFVKEGTVYGFYSEILQIHYDPAPVMYLKYPSEVEPFEFRAHKRFAGRIPARMFNDEAHYHCLINDISSGGCSLTVYQASLKGKEHVSLDDKASLVFSLSGLGEIELSCTVKSMSQEASATNYGLEFHATGEAYKQMGRYLEMLSY
ncbi:flagellar brake protein [uncultured Pseudodesulfovibrio sp.]|uniref:flagellar brake protein n=1 Tax=uncultured Pseudodesulfovibrio sp. TaxID=2035858 RepID=UPI0029C70697|nr:flagellar brake protein [uncultured Pseudodesulfovibrio sp.]